MEFNDKIKRLRDESKLSITEVSNLISINEDELSLLEEGTCQPNLDQIRKLASFYDVTIESLVDGNCEIIKNRKRT